MHEYAFIHLHIELKKNLLWLKKKKIKTTASVQTTVTLKKFHQIIVFITMWYKFVLKDTKNLSQLDCI